MTNEEHLGWFIPWVKRIFPWLMLLAIGLTLFSGVFRVESDETAMILRFGKLRGSASGDILLGPGLHFAFPYVVDEVIKVSVGKVREMRVSTLYDAGATLNTDINQNGYVLTGDENVILIESTVKYRIDDPVSYALRRESTENEIDGIISGEMTALISQTQVDSLLTTGKAQLAENIRQNAQRQLRALGCGVTITNIELVNLIPPREVQADFDAVNAAAVAKQTAIQRANEYREIIVPEAEASAERAISTAHSEQSTALTTARTFTSGLGGLLDQYAISPSVVLEGVLRKRINDVMSKMRVLITPDEADPPRLILP